MQIKNGVKEGSVSLCKEGWDFMKESKFFVNNLTKTLQYRMITISVMIINIEQDASTELSVTVNNQKGGGLWLL